MDDRADPLASYDLPGVAERLREAARLIGGPGGRDWVSTACHAGAIAVAEHPRLLAEAGQGREVLALALAYRDISRESPPEGAPDDPGQRHAQTIRQVRRSRAAREALFALLDELQPCEPHAAPTTGGDTDGR